MTSTFNPDQFMNTQIEGESSTKYEPIPPGSYQASIAKVESKLAGDKPVLDVTWQTTDPAAVEATGMDTPTVRQTIWLDINEATGGLDMGRGKNVGLGKLRAALNQNNPGQAWAPGMMIGQAALIEVNHRSGKEPGEIYANVKAVTAM
jgi:hypothetical protein